MVIRNRQTWEPGESKVQDRICGQIQNRSNKSGIGIYYLKCNILVLLGTSATIFQTEILAISNSNIWKNAIKGNVCTFQSKLTWEKLRSLKALSQTIYSTVTNVGVILLGLWRQQNCQQSYKKKIYWTRDSVWPAETLKNLVRAHFQQWIKKSHISS